MQTFDLSGKVAIVTGTSRGLGHVFLASDASEYMIGQRLLVDGGVSTGAARATAARKAQA